MIAQSIVLGMGYDFVVVSVPVFQIAPSGLKKRHVFCLGKDYAFYADWFKRNGDHESARESLGIAIDIMETCGADGWVVKYRKDLTDLQLRD